MTERDQGPPFVLVLALFVVSGAAGLIDQLCFSKYLSYVVGSTAHAVSAVLAAFMTGLALGAWLGGRYSRRVRRPLVAYGVLELVIALTVALSPAAFQALSPLYASLARSVPGSLAVLSALRWLSALLIVVVPTTAMGATLPLLTRLLPPAPDAAGEVLRERRLGALYASNMAGGALGALLAAYVILPRLGVSGTVWLSAFGSATIGVIAIHWGRRAPASTQPLVDVSAATNTPEAHGASMAYFVAAASGALVFAAEVIFTHLLALIIGNSVYAFALILAVFLACLYEGAARAAYARRRFGEAALPFGFLLAGLSLFLTLPFWDDLPALLVDTGYFSSFAMREAARGVIAFLALCVPTTFMGLSFPLLLQQRAAASADAGLWLGRLTTVNTLGAVVGSLMTGYWLLPKLGSERSLAVLASLFVATGVLTTLVVAGRARGLALAVAGVSSLVWLVAPRWDLARITAGTNVYFEARTPPDSIPFVREDLLGGVTTVTKTKGVTVLLTNGKFQGNDGWEVDAQRYFAHYPSIFVSRFDRALVIGLGTGTTLATLAAYPWQKLEVVEISPAIFEAADTYFRSVNLGVLHDARVTSHVGDGRNFLLVEQRDYDLISIELSSIWFAGAANLYSQEFYRSVAEHLTPHGVFQQWLQLHHMSRIDCATVIHTLRSVFPHVALFYGGGQGILVASRAPLLASEARVAALEALPSVTAVRPRKRPLMSLLDDALLADGELDAFLAASARDAGQSLTDLVSTDSNLYLEYATPRGNVLPATESRLLWQELKEFRGNVTARGLRAP